MDPPCNFQKQFWAINGLIHRGIGLDIELVGPGVNHTLAVWVGLLTVILVPPISNDGILTIMMVV